MNETPKRKAARNRLIFALGLLAVCIAGYLVTRSYANPQQQIPVENATSTTSTVTEGTTSSPQTTSTPRDPESSWTQKDGDTVFDGSIVCLPHRNTDGPQTLECAIGFTADNGLHYGLATKRAEDYKMTTEQPTGTRVRVSGSITPVAALSDNTWMKYDVAGLITVTAIAKL